MSEQIRAVEFNHDKEAIDRALELFAAHPFSTLETYKYFNQKGAAAAQAKAEFVEACMAGETPDAPEFDYSEIDVDELLNTRDELTAILAELPQDQKLSAEGNLVRENITNRLHEVGIMLLTKMQSELDHDDPRYELISFQLGQNLREVYGTPDPEHFKGILGYRLSKLEKVEEDNEAPALVRDAWRTVKNALPKDLPIEKPYKPKPETLAWYKEQLDVRLAPARAAVAEAIANGSITLTETGKLRGAEIVKAMNVALRVLESDDWVSETTDESNVDTTQSKKKVFVPEDREMTLLEFDAIMLAHEADQHVSRRVNGDATGVKVLGGTGANGYLGWEEGNGKANESLVKDIVQNEASAFAFYLSGGLALGLESDNNNGRNFGQTSELVWRMNFIADYLSGKHHGTESDLRVYIDKSVPHLNRIFRGTDGKVPGVVFTKDVMTYYPGQEKVYRKWDADMELSEEERLREHELERIAKIDPTRSDHRAVALTVR